MGRISEAFEAGTGLDPREFIPYFGNAVSDRRGAEGKPNLVEKLFSSDPPRSTSFSDATEYIGRGFAGLSALMGLHLFLPLAIIAVPAVYLVETYFIK